MLVYGTGSVTDEIYLDKGDDNQFERNKETEFDVSFKFKKLLFFIHKFFRL